MHLTSFGRQTNHQCVTIVNTHHIAFTRAPAVLTANFYYHEHYHVGAWPLLAMQHWRSQHSLALGWNWHMPPLHHPPPICRSRKKSRQTKQTSITPLSQTYQNQACEKPSQHTIALYCPVTVTVSACCRAASVLPP